MAAPVKQCIEMMEDYSRCGEDGALHGTPNDDDDDEVVVVVVDGGWSEGGDSSSDTADAVHR